MVSGGGGEGDACGVPKTEGGAPGRGPDFPGVNSVPSSLSFPWKRREGGYRRACVHWFVTTWQQGEHRWWVSLWLGEWLVVPPRGGAADEWSLYPCSLLLNMLSSRRICWSGCRRTAGFTGTAPSLPQMGGRYPPSPLASSTAPTSNSCHALHFRGWLG